MHLKKKSCKYFFLRKILKLSAWYRMLIKDIQLWVMLRAKGRVCGLRERGFQTLDFFADAITNGQLEGVGVVSFPCPSALF